MLCYNFEEIYKEGLIVRLRRDVETPEVTSRDHRQKQIYYFITYGICFISLGLGTATLGPMLPFLADNASVSLGQISFLFSADSLGYMLGSAGGGRLFDRFDGHKLMMLAISMMVIISILIPLTLVYILLLFVMFLFGLSKGLLDIGANVNLLWTFKSNVSPYLNGLHFSFGVGAFLAPLVINLIMSLFGEVITWPYWILAVLFLPGLIGLWWLKSPKNPDHEAHKKNNQPLDIQLILLMILLFFIYVGVEGGFSGWIFTYATELNIVGESAAAYITSLFWGALTLGRLLSMLIAKMTKPSKILLGNFILAIMALGLVIIWPKNQTILWIVSAGLGLSLSSIFPTLLALGEARMKITGTVTGLFFLGSSLGGMLVPMLLGQIFEYVGSYEIMLTLFGLTCAGLVVLIFVILASNRVPEKLRNMET